MPIAGNNVEAIPMQIVGNTLVEGAKTRIPSDRAVDANDALPLLERGNIVYVHWYGANYVSVRSALRRAGVEVSE